MKRICRNISLFFVFYLPLSAVVGLLSGSFQAPGHARSFAYELFLWFVVAVQLLAPTFCLFLLVLVVQHFCARLRRGERAWMQRTLSLVLMAAALPVCQALLWGGWQLSIEWVLAAGLPAALLGLSIQPARAQKRTA